MKHLGPKILRLFWNNYVRGATGQKDGWQTWKLKENIEKIRRYFFLPGADSLYTACLPGSHGSRARGHSRRAATCLPGSLNEGVPKLLRESFCKVTYHNSSLSLITVVDFSTKYKDSIFAPILQILESETFTIQFLSFLEEDCCFFQWRLHEDNMRIACKWREEKA